MNILDRQSPSEAIPQLEKMVNSLIDRVLPVGSLFYTSNDKYNPNKELGGIWELKSTSPSYEWHRVK